MGGAAADKKALSWSSALMVAANVRRPKCDARLFHKEPLKEFEMKLLPQSLQHPGFCMNGAFSWPMQVLR